MFKLTILQDSFLYFVFKYLNVEFEFTWNGLIFNIHFQFLCFIICLWEWTNVLSGHYLSCSNYLFPFKFPSRLNSISCWLFLNLQEQLLFIGEQDRLQHSNCYHGKDFTVATRVRIVTAPFLVLLLLMLRSRWLGCVVTGVRITACLDFGSSWWTSLSFVLPRINRTMIRCCEQTGQGGCDLVLLHSYHSLLWLFWSWLAEQHSSL